MPSLRTKIYMFLSFAFLVLLLAICFFGYVLFKQSIHSDTRNMLIYHAVLTEDHLRDPDISGAWKGKLVRAYDDISQMPEYLQYGFQWEDMNHNELYERDLTNTMNVPIYVYALKYSMRKEDGELYIVSEFLQEVEARMRYEESLFYDNSSIVFTASMIFVALITIVLGIFYKILLSPIRAVSDWLSQPSEEIPYQKIRYQELISIVQSYKQNADKRKELLEREELFLSTMSHELRTPIAIISSSVELIERIDVGNQVSKINGRISYAIKNMDYLTKTLLWLSRKKNQPLSKTEVSLPEVISNVVRDNEYLIVGRETHLTIQCQLNSEYEILENYGAIYLVLVNLIRNALQHSADGEVHIRHENGVVSIRNPIERNEVDDDFESYGYGLYLVKKICDKRGFTFSISYEDEKATAQVSFTVTD